MSQSLPQFSGTTFPNANDSYLVFTDINESNKPFIDQYYSYLNQNDFQSATQVLTEHPNLQYVIINAKVMQKMYDMIMAVETFVSSTTFYEKIGGIVKDKGDYNATVQYELWNIVYYNGLAYMVTGNNGVKPPIGTLPSSTTYFKPVTIRGVSGTGLAFHTTWNSIDNYSISDCVPYGNRLYVCIQANANKIPSDFPDYWTSVITIPQETIWSKTQPANQDTGNIWNEINDTDSSYIQHVKQSDGSYLTRFPQSNANFIKTSDGSNVQAKLDLDNKITTYTCVTTGTVHALTATVAGSNGKFLADANFVSGDTFTINGTTVSATLQNGSIPDTDFFKSGCWMNFIFDGTKLNFSAGGGNSVVPNYAGKLIIHVATSDGGSVGNTRVRIRNEQLGANYIQSLDALGNTTFNLIENYTYYVVLLDYPSNYYGGAANVTVTGGSTETVTLTLKTEPDIIGWRMNASTGAVEYTDGAVNWLAASMGTAFDAGSWGDSWLFKNIKPCVLKNGVVQYYLNPNDFTKKVDGTAADITSGTDGDVMIEFPMFYYKFYSETDINSVSWIGCKFSLTPPDGTYCANAFLSQAGVIQNVMYMSAYDGFSYNNALRSLSGKVPTVDQTIGAFRTLATANGAGYQQQEWSKRALLQSMFVLMFKGTDSQTLLGKGVSSASAAINTGTMDTKGMYWGDQTGTAGVKFCGIENFWGNINKFCDGLILVSGSFKYKIYGTYNDAATGYTTGSTISTSLSNYIDTMTLANGYGMLPATVVDTEASSKFHDRVYTSTGTNICYTGGYWNTALSAGAFYVYLYLTASSTNTLIGAALSFTPQ